MPRDSLLTFEEITAVVAVMVDLGVRTVRLTGGEPLVRRDLPVLVAALRDLGARRGVDLDLSVTTNGVLLRDQAEALAAAGLDRVNISIDSLQQHRYEELTRRDTLAAALDGVRAAREHGLGPIKINAVVMRGSNDDEVVDFARFARDEDVAVRFIEYMPLDEQHAWTPADVVSSAEVLAAIGAEFPLEDARVEPGPEPATTYRFADGAPGAVGVIPSVTAPFCDTCNRLRLTADGALRSCLFALDETDLRAPLRAGASEDELAETIRATIAAKWAGHRIGHDDFIQPARSMSRIGG